jgi:hypothetical protein
LEWDDEYGDRRSELVFIGTEYDEEALRDALTEALATGESEQSVDDLFPTEAGNETVIRQY